MPTRKGSGRKRGREKSLVKRGITHCLGPHKVGRSGIRPSTDVSEEISEERRDGKNGGMSRGGGGE